MRNCALLAIALPALAVADGEAGLEKLPLRDRLQPVPRDSGFKMADYWVWCGSAIKVGDTYHMFAARWPRATHFPEGYREHSEIVRAISKNPLGPYEFKEVVIGKRPGQFWDSGMAHNPEIHKIGDTYVLFYIGSDGVTKQPNGKYLVRKVGCATAKSITGPWTRSDQPLINTESNNPSVHVECDGSVKMVFRSSTTRARLATAPTFSGPYKIVSDNLSPEAPIEDFTLFKHGGKYHFFCEDNQGKVSGHTRWGVHFISDNGIDGWRPAGQRIAYDHTLRFTDGTTLECKRRERPQLLVVDGRATHLITTVWDGQNTWSQPVEISPAIPIETHEAAVRAGSRPKTP
jgi:hypothetical protein